MLQHRYITKLRVAIFVVCMFPFHCFSQDISGVWTGKLYNDTTKEYIPFELAINEVNGKANGFSHTTFISDSGKNVGVKAVKIKIKSDEIFVEDEKFIYNNFPEPPPRGVKMFAELNFLVQNASDVLKGTWKTNATKQYKPLTGTILLEKKKKDPENTAIVKKLEELGLAKDLAFLHAPQNSVAIDTKSREDSIRKKQEMDALATAQKARGDSIRKQQEMVAIAKAQKARGDSIKKQQEMDALAKAQKAKEDSIRNQLEMDALAIAQKSRADSIRKQQEMVAIAKAQKARGDSIRKQKEVDALANAQKSREDSLRKQQETVAKAAQLKLLHAQQAKDELARQRLAQEQTAKEQKAKEELATKQQAQEALAKTQKAKDDLERQKREQEELLKIQKANPTAAADLSKRKLEIIRTVDITQDSLIFSLYDNGTVDGDTVSVLINGKVIMPRVGLLERAINKTIYLTPEMGDSISVVMYAENLGSIPPNTGLLVIREGTKIYEIRFTGDMDKNSKIILVRKKKP